MEFITENGVLKKCTDYSKEKTVMIPEQIHTIGDSVFKGMKDIEEIILPDSIRVIENNAFKGCKNLKNINFPPRLSSIGDFAFHRCHALERVILPETLSSIGKGAFLYCDSMKEISLMGVKRIEMQMFANCTSLEEIWLSSALDISNLNDDVFTGCIKINKIHLSDGRTFLITNLISAFDSENQIIKEVAKNVYRTMKLEHGRLYRFNVNLKEVTIPEGVTTIEKSCFFDKKGIVSISLPRSLEKICSNAFGNCINLTKMEIKNPDLKIENIEENAFRGCSNLSDIIFDGNTDVVRKIREQILCEFYISGNTLVRYTGREERVRVPDGIKVISENCFLGNDKIDRVILPDTVEEIRENAFRDCTSMQTVSISENLRKIGRSAFENCRSLLKITLPKSMVSIGKSAFKRCRRLKDFDINNSLEYIGDMAFYGCEQLSEINIPFSTELDGNMIFVKSGYKTINIPEYSCPGNEKIKEFATIKPCIIGKYAFSGCKKLKSVIIIDRTSVIGDYAFEKCPDLRIVSITARQIGKGAFSFCQKLTEAYIDSPMISELAFFECHKLSNVQVTNNVKKIGERAFEECVSLEDFPFEHIEEIGERAFERCEGLTEISLYGNMKIGYHAFEDCCNLKTIDIGSEVLTESGAFFSCTYVNKIILDGKPYTFSRFAQSRYTVSNPYPERVQELIGDIYSCFDVSVKSELERYSGNSKSVKVPEDIVSLGDGAFRNCVRCENIDIPETVSLIGKLTFDKTGWIGRLREENRISTVNDMIVDAVNCGEYVEIPEHIKKIISWSFAGNTELREIKFLGEKTTVCEYAFRNCINLRKITLADGTVYTLGNHNDAPDYIKKIFFECINCFKTDDTGRLIESTGNIKNLVFPSEFRKITAIGEEVYKDCNLLETVTFSDDTEEIGAGAFKNSLWLREVRNAFSIRKIGNLAFAGCQSLEIIELSDKLQVIEKRAFEHCCNLKYIIIPEGVKKIAERTFFRCKSLESIILPSSLEVIEKEAFAFCTGLKKVIISKNTHIEKSAFDFTDAKLEYYK